MVFDLRLNTMSAVIAEFTTKTNIADNCFDKI